MFFVFSLIFSFIPFIFPTPPEMADDAKWGRSFDALMRNVIKAVGKYLTGPKTGRMEEGYRPFVETLSGFNKRPTTVNQQFNETMTDVFSGMGIFADRKFELMKGGKEQIHQHLNEMNGGAFNAAAGGDEETFETIAFMNFYYAGGCLSFHKNMNERFAAVLNTYCFMVNQAILVFMKEMLAKIDNGTIRDTLAGNLELTLTNLASRISTVQVEPFDESMMRLMGAVRTNFAKSGKKVMDTQSFQQYLMLVGVDGESLTPDELDIYYKDGVLDRCMEYFFLEKLMENNVVFQNEGGTPTDGNELMTALIQQSFNSAFDQNVETHISQPSLRKEIYQRELYDFYLIFWSNFISNYLPMLVMDFFNFTHGLALMNAAIDMPFLRSLRDIAVESDFKDPVIAFNLKWFMDKKQTSSAEKDLQQQLENPRNQAEMSLSSTFNNYDQESYANSINKAFDHAFEQLYSYTKNPDRGNILANTFSQIFEHEKDYYTMLDPIEPDNVQSWALARTFSAFVRDKFYIEDGLSEEYLRTSKSEGADVLGQLTNMSFKAYLFNWVFVANLMIKWIPANGIPSFNYYLFNTFLRPYTLNEIAEHEPDEEESDIQPDEITFQIPFPNFLAQIRDPTHLPSIFSDFYLV